MTDFLDTRLTAIERRLEQASRVEPSPALRHRVIMALDDVLNEKEKVPKEKVPATKFGEVRQACIPFYPDLVAGTFIGTDLVAGTFIGTFIAAGLLVAASVVVSGLSVGRIQPLTLSQRMRIANVSEDGLLVATAASSVIPDAAALPFDAKDAPQGATGVRVIDARRVLEEIL